MVSHATLATKRPTVSCLDVTRPTRRDSFSRTARLAPVNRSASDANLLSEAPRSSERRHLTTGMMPMAATGRLGSEPPPEPASRGRWGGQSEGGGILRPSISESQLHVRNTVARINAASKVQQQEPSWKRKPVDDDQNSENPFKAMLRSADEFLKDDTEHQPRFSSTLVWNRSLTPQKTTNSHLLSRCASAAGVMMTSSAANNSQIRTKRSQSLEPEIVTGRPPPAYRPGQLVSRSCSTEPESPRMRSLAGSRLTSPSLTNHHVQTTWQTEDDAASRILVDQSRGSGKRLLGRALPIIFACGVEK